MWQSFRNRFADVLSGPRALQQAVEQNRLERFFTFPNFARSARRCADVMRAAGLADVEVESFPADGRTDWSGWRAMKAWDVAHARLDLVAPERARLADWSRIPQQLVMYSGPAQTAAELVEWNGEPETDLLGKIPLTRLRINDLFPQMQARRVPGIVSDFVGTLPGVRDAFDQPDAVRWENSAIRPAAGEHWGFMISPRQGERLRALLRQGTVRVEVDIASRCYEGEFLSATGVIPGAGGTGEEVLLVTHLYEPGANDNASGVGLGLEIARALNAAIAEGIVARPKRGIRFLFAWEGYGLQAWFHRHADRLPRLIGGINIDEIGVDQDKGRSVLHLFRPPAANPSCIGLLTEHLCAEILPASVRWKSVADRADIINDTVTADPHLNVVLPCLIQYPARVYHLSSDTPDLLDPELMKSIGLIAATHLHFLADAGGPAIRVLGRLVAESVRRNLQRAEPRLREGNWPFDAVRTERWFREQARLAADSLRRFGPEGTVAAEGIRPELDVRIGEWLAARRNVFPPEPSHVTRPEDLRRAARLVLSRATFGSPRAVGSLTLPAEEEQRYRDTLYAHRLDLLVHRICYWSDGQRNLLDILDRLEFELDEMRADTAIARTSSGSLIDASDSPRIDVGAALTVVDHLIRGGFLRAGEKV